MPRLTSGVIIFAIGTLAALALPHSASAQLHAAAVASGLSQPVAFVQDPADADVQVIVEQGGRVRVLKRGVLQTVDLIDLSNDIAFGGEQGLLGLAFAPDFAQSGRVFLSFTNRAGNSVIARFTRASSDPLRLDPASRFDLQWSTGERFIRQPFTNHNGGNITFGPDGYLYVGFGDGGSGDDPGARPPRGVGAPPRQGARPRPRDVDPRTAGVARRRRAAGVGSVHRHGRRPPCAGARRRRRRAGRRAAPVGRLGARTQPRPDRVGAPAGAVGHRACSRRRGRARRRRRSRIGQGTARPRTAAVEQGPLRHGARARRARSGSRTRSRRPARAPARRSADRRRRSPACP